MPWKRKGKPWETRFGKPSGPWVTWIKRFTTGPGYWIAVRSTLDLVLDYGSRSH